MTKEPILKDHFFIPVTSSATSTGTKETQPDDFTTRRQSLFVPEDFSEESDVNFLDVSRHTLNPIETLYKQHGYLNKNNSRHTVNFFPFSRHTVIFLDVSRHTLNPIETL